MSYRCCCCCLYSTMSPDREVLVGEEPQLEFGGIEALGKLMKVLGLSVEVCLLLLPMLVHPPANAER